MQIRKLKPLPHHISSNTVLCCVCICVVISHWYALLCLFFPTRHGNSVLLHAEMVPNSVSVFISVHPPFHDALWLPARGLPCPVLLCPQSFSLSLTVSLFPSPLSLLRHSFDLFLPCWSRSDTCGRERRRRRQECQILSCADTLGQFHQTFFFFFCFCCFFSSAFWQPIIKDGRAWAHTQR